MVKFDHMTLPVSDVRKSRDWYVNNLGFKVEFERGGIIAIQDSAGFTIFLRKASNFGRRQGNPHHPAEERRSHA